MILEAQGIQMVDTPENGTAQRLSDGILPPRAYTDPDVFRAEADGIFRRCWLFVGFTDDLAGDNDFITADIAGTSVVVQNFGGELRALHNVCSHRFARIHDKPCGNRRLQCPYHGWLYNKDGVPAGIPGNEDFFGLDRTARQTRALQRFEVATRGRFVFVRLDPGGPSLDVHLGAYGPVLDHASAMFPTRFDDQTLDWAANWKIGVESVLEVYHVETTHPETFKPFFKKIWNVAESGPHSLGQAVLSDAGERYWNGIVKHLGLRRTDRHSGYENYLIFPNLAVGITHGSMLSVQTYDPIDDGRCALRFRLLLADSDHPERRERAAWRHVVESLRAINLRVLAEDRVVSESVQRGIRQARWPAIPGWNEDRIRAFHRAYGAWMDGWRACMEQT